MRCRTQKHWKHLPNQRRIQRGGLGWSPT